MEAGTNTLTVKNYLSWCSVSINGSTPSTNAVLTLSPAVGTIDLAASPASSTFELGPAPWHDTSGDTGNGDPGTVTGMTSSTTVVVNSASNACVWVCCPFTNGTGCPTTNQCP